MDFYSHLLSYLDEKQINALLESLGKESKSAFLVNTNKISAEEILKMYPGIEKHPIVKDAFIFDKIKYPLGKSLLHELGAIYIQEPSAMLPSYFLSYDDNDYILDMCSAPGGKSIQAYIRSKDGTVIISNDISNSRQSLTLENIERLGIGNICLTSHDFSLDYHKYKNKFSKIILDAPCSGSGMFRKEDKMKQDWTYEKVLRFSNIQKKLLIAAYEMLMPGGEIIYSTCSFSYEEDEEVVLSLLKETDAKIVPFDINPLFYVDKSNIGIHLFPHIFPGEGHYLAKIKKPGKLALTSKKINKEIKTKDCSFIQVINLESKDIHIIRNGIKKSIFKGDYECYEHHYARYLNRYEKQIDLSKEDTIKYIKGEPLYIKSNYKGEVLLKYNNLSVDFAKTDGNIIKNRYPKGLRKNIYL